MADRDLPTAGLPSRSPSSYGDRGSSDANGHRHRDDSPDETLSPTSVIYFKEALSSVNVRFGKAGGSSTSPTPSPHKYDFHIERVDSKRKNKKIR